ncbi:MAG: polysaccharide biosynthesis/export family protein [Candidatus Methylomirabilales bacterium]
MGCATPPPPHPLVSEQTAVFSTTPVPVRPYVIRPSDDLTITVYKHSDFSPLFDLKSVPVLPDGKVSIPLIGEVTVVGLTPGQLRDQISAHLEEFLVHPIVNVTVHATKPKAYVLGEVKNPGLYRLDHDTSAVESLALAGGVTRDGDLSRIVLLRTARADDVTANAIATVDVEELLRQADVRQNVILRGGDILYVPPDYISRTNRLFAHISTLLDPFTRVLGTAIQAVILTIAADRGD